MNNQLANQVLDLDLLARVTGGVGGGLGGPGPGGGKPHAPPTHQTKLIPGTKDQRVAAAKIAGAAVIGGAVGGPPGAIIGGGGAALDSIIENWESIGKWRPW